MSLLSRSTRAVWWCCVAWSVVALPARAEEPVHVIEFRYTPVARAQIAVWVEDKDGLFLGTVALTEAVAYRGLGNRPGASQMNSGYRWPYGRREGVLPIWAHRRAAAPGARPFPRVIFQERPEGFASRLVADQSPDNYHCLQFDPSRSARDELDAVSCATLFSSDKGRYLTDADQTTRAYVEPWQDGIGVGSLRPLPRFSLYPPRMDVKRCDAPACFDHPDVARFADDARTVMPEIDAVTRATAPGGEAQRFLYSVPAAWKPGEYVAFIEVNVEGDYNEHWSAEAHPTPVLPDSAWDSFSMDYGYPYRGQPSIVYALPFTIGDSSQTRFATADPAGRSSWQHWNPDFGEMEAVSMRPGDPDGMADRGGSGADRLQRDASGERFSAELKTVDASELPEPGIERPAEQPDPTVGPVRDLTVRHHEDPLRSHTWIRMSFVNAYAERPLFAYEVRVGTEPIADVETFIRNGRPAKNATDDAEGATALILPVEVIDGTVIEAAIGDLVAETHYYVAVRATDELNRSGPIEVVEIDTTRRTFATVTPCFVATAAYGTPLAAEVSVLRGLRDRYLQSNVLGRALVSAYYAVSPALAAVVARSRALRASARVLLTPLVAAARQLSPPPSAASR